MELRTARERAKANRIELQLHAQASARQQRELGAFVRFCVARLERELGPSERWIVKIDPSSGGFRSMVAMHDGALAIESTGRGLDGPLAVWDALCRLEQAVREARAGRTLRAPDERFDGA